MKKWYRLLTAKSPEIMFVRDIFSSTFVYFIFMVCAHLVDGVLPSHSGNKQLAGLHAFKVDIEIYSFYALLVTNLVRYLINRSSVIIKEFREKLLREIKLTIVEIKSRG